mgnify:CR=1 FL=1
MVSACIEITTTRDIARQILRHRSFSFQEFSQRYADPTQDLSFVLRAARLQDTRNRQNSIETNNEDLALWWDSAQQEVIMLAQKHYARAIELGIAKEQARAILPEGNTVSRLYMNGTLRSWIHFIQLRSANGTQREHQQVAVACAQVIAQIEGKVSEEEAKEETKRATRQYARRQETWFSRDERITWISPIQNSLELILESIN